MKLAAVILAAGASTRLGSPKQLIRLHGETLLDHTLYAAQSAGCDPLLVVLGSSAEAIRKECHLTAATVLLNQHWREGMSTSIRTGIAALPIDVSAVLLLTCDQINITAEHLQNLISATNLSQQPTASSYSGKRGIPACLPRDWFPRLLALQGDTGAGSLLTGVEGIPLPGGEVDIDTPEDLQRLSPKAAASA